MRLGPRWFPGKIPKSSTNFKDFLGARSTGLIEVWAIFEIMPLDYWWSPNCTSDTERIRVS